MRRVVALVLGMVVWVAVVVAVHMVSFLLLGKSLSGVLSPYGAVPATVAVIGQAWFAL